MNWAILIATVLGALGTAFEPNLNQIAKDNVAIVAIVSAVLTGLASITKSILDKQGK